MFLELLLIAAQKGPGPIINQASTFKTAHYTITITTHCHEGDVGCDHVTYKSVSTTGKVFTLQGKEEMRPCATDNVTPCASLGYFFRNGAFEYSVPPDMMDGDLLVRRGGKDILRESGRWMDSQ